MKRLLALLGGFIGLLFAVWEAMINAADTAPLDQEWGITITSRSFFISQIVVYVLIGAVTGWLTGFMVDRVRKRK